MSEPLNWLAEPLGYAFYRRAVLVAMVVGATGGLLGAFIVVRRSVLMVEALSHSLLPGIAAAVLLAGLSPLAALAGGLSSALGVALGSQWLGRHSRLSQETAFGLLFVTAFALGVVLLAYAPAHADVGHYLLGNIIGMSDDDIRLVCATASLSFLALVMLQRPMIIALFDRHSAPTLGVRVDLMHGVLVVLVVLVLIVAVQAAGVLLAVGFLVLPAVTMLPHARSFRALLWSSVVYGAVIPPVSLVFGYWIDLPPGPGIIALMGMLAVLSQVAGMVAGKRCRAECQVAVKK